MTKPDPFELWAKRAGADMASAAYRVLSRYVDPVEAWDAWKEVQRGADPVELYHRRDDCRELGVALSASDEEVKEAYRAIARDCHPDRTTDEAKRERFKRATSARDRLLSR